MIALESYLVHSTWSFGFEWARIAQWIVEGYGFSSPYLDYPKPSAVMAPGYVFFLAGVFSIFGVYSVTSAMLVIIIQSLLGAFTCVLFYFIGYRIDGAYTGRIASIMLALYPPAVYFSAVRIVTAVSAVFLLAGIVYLVFRLIDDRRVVFSSCAGVLMGLAALIEPTIITFYPFMLGWLFFRYGGPRKECFKHIVVMSGIVIVCVIPWTIRNYLVFNKLVLIKSPLGMNLLYGNSRFGNGVVPPKNVSYFSAAEKEKLSLMDEIDVDRAMMHMALSFISENPRIFLQRTLRRFLAYWTSVTGYRNTRFDLFVGVVHGSLLVLAVLGSVLAYRSGALPRFIPLFFLFASYPVVFYVTHFMAYRYRFPTEAFLIFLAAFGIKETLLRFRVIK